ncbi:MAG: response regulator transcription factor [Saprospiraceae bacterium]|nr:response regulator transcription factor [Saprospiraceae bacterium]
MNEIRVLIVEDEPLIAHDIAATLQGFDYTVAGIAPNGAKALVELQQNTPDFVLLDISLGSEPDGIQLGALIRDRFDIPFVYLSSHSDAGTLDRAKHTLPMGYLVKPFDEKGLFTTIEIALFNFARLRKPLRLGIEDLNARLLSKLTPREFELLVDIYDGKTNGQLAERHFISANTVKTHVKNLYAKLNVQSRAEAIVLLRKMGK